MDSENKLYSKYGNILLMDFGSDSGKDCLELSRGLAASWLGIMCCLLLALSVVLQLLCPGP